MNGTNHVIPAVGDADLGVGTKESLALVVHVRRLAFDYGSGLSNKLLTSEKRSRAD